MEVFRIPISPVLPLADGKKLKKFSKQMTTWLENDFGMFMSQKFYVNKLDFINYCIDQDSGFFFMPSGCGKTVLCYMLRYFFDKETSESIRLLFESSLKTAHCETNIEHLAKYNIIQLNMEDFNYRGINSADTFQTRMLEYLESKVCSKYPYLKNDFEVTNRNNLQFLFRRICRKISEEEGGKCVLLLDCIEAPVNWMASRNCRLKTEEKRTISHIYLYMLHDMLTPCNYIFITLFFGVHEPYGFYSTSVTMSDQVFDLRSRDAAKYFFFSSTEVQNLLSKHKNCEINLEQLKLTYGGYPGDLFLPGSVILAVCLAEGPYVFRGWRKNIGDQLIAESDLALLLTYFLCEESASISPNYEKSVECVLNNPEAAYAFFIKAGILTHEKTNLESKLSFTNNEAENLALRFIQRQFDVEKYLPQLDAIDLALKTGNVALFEENVNVILETYGTKEIRVERNYRNILHFLILCSAGKSFKFPSTMKKRLGSTVIGRSGHYDLKVGAKDYSILYIIEIKTILKKSGPRDIKTDKEFNNLVSSIKKFAFMQMRSCRYISRNDLTKYKNVILMAVVGFEKRIFAFKENFQHLEGDNLFLS